MHSWKRVGLAGLFLVAAFALCVAGAATIDDRWPYPTKGSIVEDYDRHVGDDAHLYGVVSRVDAGQPTVRIDGGTSSIELAVTDTDVRVEPGGAIQVTGTLRPNHRIMATDVVVVNASSGAKLWKYVTSLGGLALFLGLFFRRWRINLRHLQLEAREDG